MTISHEVLLTAWPLLRDDWLADARADRVIRTRLHATAIDWAQDSRDPSYLYSGSRLDAAAAMAARIKADPRQIPLSQADKDFLHASHRAGRRQARTRQQLIAVLLALVAALATVWIIAVRAERAATTQRDIAVSRQLISESEALGTDPAIARLEAIAAWALSPSAQAHYAMLAAAANPQTATITADPAGITSVAFSPDGKTLATGGPDSAKLLDVATGRQTGARLAVGTGDLTSSVAFSPDGKTLATGGRTKRTAVGRGHRPSASQPLPAGRKVGSVAFSPDGKILATGGPGGIALWDVATGDQPARLAAGQINSVAFSPDGKTLATGGDDGSAAVGRGHRPPGRQTTLRRAQYGRPDRLGGVQPGRQDARHRQPGRQGVAVGPGHRPPDRQSTARRSWGQPGGVQSGQQDTGHRRRRRRAAVGRGHRPPDRRHAHRRLRRPDELSGVQPGRQDAGHRQPGRQGPAVGRGCGDVPPVRLPAC